MAVVEIATAGSRRGGGIGGIIEGMEGIGRIIGGILVRAKQMRQRPSKNYDDDYDYYYDDNKLQKLEDALVEQMLTSAIFAKLCKIVKISQRL